MEDFDAWRPYLSGVIGAAIAIWLSFLSRNKIPKPREHQNAKANRAYYKKVGKLSNFLSGGFLVVTLLLYLFSVFPDNYGPPILVTLFLCFYSHLMTGSIESLRNDSFQWKGYLIVLLAEAKLSWTIYYIVMSIFALVGMGGFLLLYLAPPGT